MSYIVQLKGPIVRGLIFRGCDKKIRVAYVPPVPVGVYRMYDFLEIHRRGGKKRRRRPHFLLFKIQLSH